MVLILLHFNGVGKERDKMFVVAAKWRDKMFVVAAKWHGQKQIECSMEQFHVLGHIFQIRASERDAARQQYRRRRRDIELDVLM